MKHRREIGTKYEELAATWLEEQGYCIVARNFYCRQGEIDIIADKDDVLIFIEVKYSTSEADGLPEERVTAAKKKKIVYAARYYMWKNGISEDCNCRFDVITILKDNIKHYENAFEA